jgi:hypothetical protein
MQHFNRVERIVTGNKTRWQQPDSISSLNERQLQMHVVDFSRNHGGKACTAHLIDEVCPKEAPERIEHPGCSAQAFPIAVDVACRALNDLHTIRRDNTRQQRWRRGSTFGKRHDCNVEFTREQPVK